MTRDRAQTHTTHKQRDEIGASILNQTRVSLRFCRLIMQHTAEHSSTIYIEERSAQCELGTVYSPDIYQTTHIPSKRRALARMFVPNIPHVAIGQKL